MKLKAIIKLFTIFLLLLTASYSHAKGERYGLSAGIISLTTADNEGKSDGNEVLKFGIVHTRPIDPNNARWRWWLGLNYLTSDAPAPANGIYEEIQNIELRVVPQYAIPAFDWLTAFLGAGVSVGYSSYTDRWNVDADGYRYGDQLEDVSGAEVGLVINAGTVIKLGSNPDQHLQLIPQVSYIQPLNEGLGGLELSFSILF